MPLRDAVVGAACGALLSVLVSHVVAPALQRRRERAALLASASASASVSSSSSSSTCPRGKVFLVGAGPGDLGLLTVRAQQLLRVATVLVVDDLVARDALSPLLARDCEVAYVGKRGGKADSTPQTDIDALLVARCRAGALVVRLKGGDPMVFGRVFSEIRALVQTRCAFEVVPGISSALAAPAAAHIPITHKTESRSFLVVSLHKPDEMDFALLAQIETLVVLMATRTLRTVAERLVAHGRAPETPVALVHNGTLPTQVTLRGTLADIAERASGRSYSPAIIVIGTVAKYAELSEYVEPDDADETDDATV
ncbi:hypothetical protein P43SY_001870 [Pythium insidiosum]|uniref:uroporphyrinogen-III C-methyltransferase n=1 Tax=Pythium insidiosum TaxID=114742 RepID=A0AAD5Q645_PYTIN|nr:hypothetical protein P43SY_001870 [Pythium insidiosum]